MARFILRYRTYNFTEKNPVIDRVRTLLQKEDMYAKKKRRLLHELTGVSIATYDGWFEGNTKSPRHETVAATITALGWKEDYVKVEEIDIEKELVAARAWRAKQMKVRDAARKTLASAKVVPMKRKKT